MKKRTVIILAVVAVLAFGAIAYALVSMPPSSEHVWPTESASSDVVSATTTTPTTATAQSAGPKPACSVSTDKKLYAPGTPMQVTWTSTNASNAMFVEHMESFIDNPSAPVMIPSGTGSPVNAPRDTKAPQGSSTFNTSYGSSYEMLLLKVTGPGGEGYCGTSYYVGKNENPAGSIPQTFSKPPTSIAFNLHSEQAVSQDGSLSIISVDSGYVSDAHGVVSGGHAVFVVSDKEVAFPVFVSTKVSPVVPLTSGKVRFSIAFTNGELVLTLTPQ